MSDEVEIHPIVRTLQALREGGQIKRWQNRPHHGEQTVGEHIYNMLCMVMILHPGATSQLIHAILIHELPERWSNDLPGPIKKHPVLIDALRLFDQRVFASMGLSVSLNAEDHAWLKALDHVDRILWAKEQITLGNLNALLVIELELAWFKEHQDKVPKAVLEMIENWPKERGSDLVP